mgnify:FL=1
MKTGTTIEKSEIYLLNKKLRLYQPENGFRTSIDSVILAASLPDDFKGQILDLGCGVGGSCLPALWRLSQIEVTGIDIRNEFIELANENAVLNKLHRRANFFTGDITKLKPDENMKGYDGVICNPPYLEDGKHIQSPSPLTRVARGRYDSTLSDWIVSARKMLKHEGMLCIIHRADWLDRILVLLHNHFGATEIFPIYSKPEQPAKRIVIRTRKGRKTPLKIMPGLTLMTKEGQETQSSKNIARHGLALDKCLNN